jgi:hypothetical protein
MTRAEKMAAKIRVFTSFDYDHDEAPRHLLVGRFKHSDSPLEMLGWSVKDPFPVDWKAHVRTKIRGVDQVLVLCGEYTHLATGVAAEVIIAREERKPYLLLAGYPDRYCSRPTSVLPGDKVYKWTWDNLQALIGNERSRAAEQVERPFLKCSAGGMLLRAGDGGKVIIPCQPLAGVRSGSVVDAISRNRL